MNAQHTPGPWEVNNSDVGIIGIARPIPDWPAGFHDKIAECVLMRNPDENRANARLIAAAPELLAALREMVALTELHIAERSGTPEEENEFLSCAYLINARALLTHIEGVVT